MDQDHKPVFAKTQADANSSQSVTVHWHALELISVTDEEKQYSEFQRARLTMRTFTLDVEAGPHSRLPYGGNESQTPSSPNLLQADAKTSQSDANTTYPNNLIHKSVTVHCKIS